MSITIIPQGASPSDTRATKRAFQDRFPKTANGVSTKWDVMKMFLTSDSYAQSLGVVAPILFDLRMLITTGMERLNASAYVNMEPGGEAAALTLLLTQPGLPSAFALSTAERDAIMALPLLDNEKYTGP